MATTNKGTPSMFPAITQNRAVSARELYEFLEIKSEFTHWSKRMFDYGFTEGVDYLVVKNDAQVPHQGGFRKVTETDYALTLDTAKEISMIQRSEKGKAARQYFIEAEKELHQVKAAAVVPVVRGPIRARELYAEMELKMSYLDFFARVLTSGTYGTDYRLVASGDTYPTDALLSADYAEHQRQMGYATRRRSVGLPQAPPKMPKAVKVGTRKQPISFTIQIAQ